MFLPVAIGVLMMLAGLGLVIYGVIPETGWYYKSTVSAIHGVSLREATEFEWGPFRSLDDCEKANQDQLQRGGSAPLTRCYRRP